jgi:hypothetical protein
VLALGGLPPLAGFMSKWQIFVAGFATHNTWFIVLVILRRAQQRDLLGYYAPLVTACTVTSHPRSSKPASHLAQHEHLHGGLIGFVDDHCDWFLSHPVKLVDGSGCNNAAGGIHRMVRS